MVFSKIDRFLIIDIMKGQEMSIFMFFNSASGSGVGKILNEQQIDRIDFNLQGNVYDVYFYNLRTSAEKGFNHLKSFTLLNRTVIVVVCGGDGTVMWVVSEIAKYQIDPEKLNIGIVPLGTGNDFSRNLGWGGNQDTLTQNSFQELKRLIRQWKKAKVQYLDLWEVEIEVLENGYFTKVSNNQVKVIEGKRLIKHFCNYFSFGIDGEIGYEFDKHRTGTRLGNFAVYGMMGIKTGLQKVKNLGELVEVMEMGSGQTVFQGNNKGFMDYVKNPFSFNFGDLVQGVKKVTSFHNNQNLLALNINSYMGGVSDIWKKAKDNQSIKIKSQTTQPSHSDGKIQFVSFGDSGKIGLEKTFGNTLDLGFAQRIVQGEGPFYIKFREYPKEADHHTFLQIDGQFIKVIGPKSLVLKKSSLINGSRIKVLHKV